MLFLFEFAFYKSSPSAVSGNSILQFLKPKLASSLTVFFPAPPHAMYKLIQLNVSANPTNSTSKICPKLPHSSPSRPCGYSTPWLLLPSSSAPLPSHLRQQPERLLLSPGLILGSLSLSKSSHGSHLSEWELKAFAGSRLSSPFLALSLVLSSHIHRPPCSLHFLISQGF